MWFVRKVLQDCDGGPTILGLYFKTALVTDADAWLGELSLNAWLAPGGIRLPHVHNQLP